MDVLAIERGEECAIQAVDDGAGVAVAAVLEVLDRGDLADIGLPVGQNLPQDMSARSNLVGQADEFSEELLFAR